MRAHVSTTITALFILATACESVESKNVRTDGIFADLEASADGDGSTTLTAALKVGGSNGSYMDLADGDKLIAHHGSDQTEMTLSDSLFGVRRYSATFNADQAGESFRIAFEREAHDDTEEACRGGGAPDSSASLPRGFSISSPASGAPLSRGGDEIVIRWDRASDGDEMEAELTGSCIHSKTIDIDGDPGSVSVSRDSLDARDGEVGTTCEVTIELKRKRPGTVDSAYGEGGRFSAEQMRTITIQSQP